MQSDKSKEKILRRIKKALKKTPIEQVEHIDKPFLIEMDKPVIEYFTQQLEKIQGEVIRCTDSDGLKIQLANAIKSRNKDIDVKPYCIDKNIQQLLKSAEIDFTDTEEDFKSMNIGISRPEYLVARTGSVIFASAQDSGRRINVYPPVHFIIANENQIVPELEDALIGIRERYDTIPSTISVITGPSRTADIEKTLIIGAHGPKDFVVFLVKKNFFK